MGSAVVRSLLDAGHDVKALVRKGSNGRNLDGLGIEIEHGDITDYDSVRNAMKGCDTVFHLAAMVAFWAPIKDLPRFYAVNVQGTKNVLGAAEKLGVKKVVYTSTISSIGSYGKESPTNEERSFNLWNMSMDYERSKYSAEFEAWRFAARGLPLVVVMPTAPVGPRDIKPNPVGKLILDFLSRKLPGYIDGGGNFIDVDDLGYGHVLAAEKGKPGQRYLLGDANIDTFSLFSALEEISGVAAPRWKLPYGLTLGLAYLLQFTSDRLTNRHPLFTPSLIKFSHTYYFADTSKATAELDFRPRSTVKKAAAKAIKWFLDNDYLRATEKKKRMIYQRIERHLH